MSRRIEELEKRVASMSKADAIKYVKDQRFLNNMIDHWSNEDLQFDSACFRILAELTRKE